jgi:hypothetical protein
MPVTHYTTTIFNQYSTTDTTGNLFLNLFHHINCVWFQASAAKQMRTVLFRVITFHNNPEECNSHQISCAQRMTIFWKDFTYQTQDIHGVFTSVSTTSAYWSTSWTQRKNSCTSVLLASNPLDTDQWKQHPQYLLPSHHLSISIF